MIENTFSQIATVERLGYTDNKSSYAEQVDPIAGHLQQANAYVAVQAASMYTVSHLFWCRVDADVKVNDNLVIAGNTYSVNGIQTNDYGENKHLECHLERV